MPELSSGEHMVSWLFRIGPGKKDGPLEAGDLRDWEHLLGIEWTPWQAETLYRMSQAYVSEMHAAQKHDAVPPWKPAVPMWQWVRNQKAERALDRFEEAEERRARFLERKQQRERNGDRQ